MSGRPYDAVRTMVEGHGGTMVYEHEGYRHGAWVVRIGDQSVIFEASGNQWFPFLDELHVPLRRYPKHYGDYSGDLVPDAEERLLSLLHGELPADEAEGLAALIEQAKWKFGWTYARTYPHEYTTKDLCSLEDHARLIDCIERYGAVERFGNERRRYFYFEERKFWHMGDPYSDDPEERPNVINRTWVDVRRHADNVKHVWGPEEVELQQRLWEIQLQKNTDRPR